MRILLTGASGFIGRHVREALNRRGYAVVAGRAPLPGAVHEEFVFTDFAHDFRISDWAPKLSGSDLVINAVGIVRETRLETFEAIHVRTPRALVRRMCHRGVQRVIQISDSMRTPAPVVNRSQQKTGRRAPRQPSSGWDHRSPVTGVRRRRGEPEVINRAVVVGLHSAGGTWYSDVATRPHRRCHLRYLHADRSRSETADPCSICGACTRHLARLPCDAPRILGLGQARCLRIPIAVMRWTARATELLPAVS
jgi:hypothetical protein